MYRMVAENIAVTKLGAQCECVQDGKIALEMFMSSPAGYYDAILMDIQMPNMDGYEAAKRIRASKYPKTGRISIIALAVNAFA